MKNMKNFNIILMSPLPPPVGGIGTWTSKYMSVSSNYGINILNVDEKVIGREVFGKKSKINLFKEIKRCFRIWKSLEKALKFKKFNIVHCSIPALQTSILRELISLFIVHRNNAKFIIHFHSTTPISIKSKLGKILFSKMLHKSDAIIVLNEKSFKHCQSILNLKDDKIFVIPNFIDNSILTLQKKYNDKLTSVFYSGGVTEEKGLKILLEAASQLKNIEFRLAGKVDKEIKEYQKKNNLENINFLGVLNQDEIKNEYLSNDIFVFPTFYQNEAFSISLLEAMSFGMPCIATDWAANRDMLNNDELIVPIKNPISIVELIKKLSEKDIRKKIGSDNKKRVIENYSENIVINKYIDVYKFVL